MKFNVKTTKDKDWRAIVEEQRQEWADPAAAALKETVSAAKQEGWTDVLRANPFLRESAFMQNIREGLQVFFSGTEGLPGQEPKAVIFHRMKIASVFEQGGTIEGKPLLWLPTRRGDPSPRQSGKKLVSATVRGQPMLFDAFDRDRHRKPLYVGVRRVRIRKAFRLREALRKHIGRISETFGKHFRR